MGTEYTMDGLRLDYPAGWKVESKSDNAAAFLPPGNEITDIFSCKLSVMKTGLEKFSKMPDLKGKPLTLDNIAEATVKGMKTQGYKISSENALKIGGLDAKKIGIELDVDGTKLRMDQYIALKEKSAYLISYSAKPQEYEKYLSEISGVLQSIRF